MAGTKVSTLKTDRGVYINARDLLLWAYESEVFDKKALLNKLKNVSRSMK